MDRQLHFMSAGLKQMLEMYASIANVEGRNTFIEGLDYVRTYSRGPEEEWHTLVSTDFPSSDNMLIATVCKRTPNGESPLQHFMTIGMVWDKEKNEWSFHS